MPMPHHEYRPYETVDLPDRTWPDVVLDARADLVLDRPARRQPGARQPDGRRAQAALLRPAARARLQGDRGRLPGGVEDGLRLRAAARRGGPDPRRRDDRGPDAGAARADRADVRVDRGRASARSCISTTRRRRRSGASSSGSTRRASPSSPCAAPRCASGSRARAAPTIVFEYSPESFHHTELDYALEICEAVAAEWGPTPRREDDRQPADDGRALPAERLRRPDRVVRAQLLAARRERSSPSTRTTTAAPRSRRRSSA